MKEEENTIICLFLNEKTVVKYNDINMCKSMTAVHIIGLSYTTIGCWHTPKYRLYSIIMGIVNFGSLNSVEYWTGILDYWNGILDYWNDLLHSECSTAKQCTETLPE